MRQRAFARSTSSRAFSALAAAVAAFAALTGLLAVGGSPARAQSQAVPKNTGEPAISGNVVVRSTLSASQGSWSGSPTSYAYQWVRCAASGSKSDGSDCAAIGGASTSKYVVANADVGWRLRVRVTASNADGSATAASNPTAVVAAPSAGPPRNRIRPAITGTPARDETLHVNPGTWTGEQPITFSFQWLRCDSGGGNCLTLPGFNDDAYVVREGDIGKRLRVRVTARNSDGTADRLTAATGVVQGPSLPPGAIKLSNGEISIPVTSVTGRLLVDSVSFDPNPVRTRQTTITIRVKVKDNRGYVVRDALVFVRSTPLVTTPAGNQKTGQDGWVTITVQTEADFPIRNDYSVQFFVKVFKQGDHPLAGIAGYRLVQVGTAR